MSTEIDYLVEFEYPLDDVRTKALGRMLELKRDTAKEFALLEELEEFEKDLRKAINRIIRIKELEKRIG